jgi:hypothetical protein
LRCECQSLHVLSKCIACPQCIVLVSQGQHGVGHAKTSTVDV